MKHKILKTFVILWLTIITCDLFSETNTNWEGMFLGTNTFFAEETNGIQPALYIEPAIITNGTPIKCYFVLKSSTNFLNLYLPPKENRFQLKLYDEKGSPVSNTLKGKELGSPLTKPFKVRNGLNLQDGYAGFSLIQNQTGLLGGFDFCLQDYFNIVKPGQYRLEAQLNIIWFPPGWKGSSRGTNVPIMSFPPINAQFEVKAQSSTSGKAGGLKL
jgi:hypothetical protein